MNHPWPPLHGIPVRFSPGLRAHDLIVRDGYVMVRDTMTMQRRLQGVRWHEEAANCPTWATPISSGAVGCRCDVDPS